MDQAANSETDNYADLHRRIGKIPRAATSQERNVQWIDPAHAIGVSRDQHGRLELFLTGPALDCSSALVGAHVSHDQWFTSHQEAVKANRIMLPSETHFDAVAAFLCAHLIENQYLTDRMGGFRRSEPVLEMALERSRLQGESMVGLIGELLLMRALFEHQPSDTARIVNSWFGAGRSARDFQIGAIGVEVKTTRSSSSTHHIQGVHQIELGNAVGGGLETDLYLVSIGIEEVPDSEDTTNSSNSISLPSLVAQLLARVESGTSSEEQALGLSEILTAKIQAYGAGTGFGYDHSQMNHRTLFGTRWRISFARAYDVTDDAISVPRSPDLSSYSMVLPSTVEFTLSLPARVRGDINPVTGLSSIVEILLGRWIAGSEVKAEN